MSTTSVEIKAYSVYSVNLLPRGKMRELVFSKLPDVPDLPKLWGHAQTSGRCRLLQEVLGLRDRLLIPARVRLPGQQSAAAQRSITLPLRCYSRKGYLYPAVKLLIQRAIERAAHW